jgi:hypothetical protein
VFNVTGSAVVANGITAGNVISVGGELMLVTLVSGANGTRITVQRGYEGTTAAPHSSGDPVLGATYNDGKPPTKSDKCNDKDSAAQGGDHPDMDIAFLNAGSPSGGNPLDNVSGTLYAAGRRADFENALFGSANLAVVASCVFIDSGDVPGNASTLTFDPNGGSAIAGVMPTLSG